MAALTDFDRYRFIARLGQGGMSTVALAEDTVLGRRVALKRVSADDDRGLVRLRREALIGASVSHPNLVSIYDIVSSDDGDDVIIMEYVRGQTLRDALREQPRLAPDEVLRICAGVAAGLDAIHRQGIVHRDVKPGNILLGDDGAVKLADLGIASAPDRTRITTAGAVMGTFSYMAPEQLEGVEPTKAVDVYALAAVTFEALSGRKAHEETNPLALAHAIATQPPPDLRSAWPAAPVGAAEVLEQGMARDPAARPRSASQLVQRLRQSFDKPPADTAPATVPPARFSGPPPAVPGASRTAKIAAGLLGLLALAVALVVILASGGSSTRPRHSASHHRTRGRTSRSATATASSTTAQSTVTSSTASSVSAPSAAAASPTVPAAGGPVSAVESFYTNAAAHRYSQAWALADPSFRSQLGGYSSFQAGQQGDRSITFDEARTLSQSPSSATVAIRTTSVRDTGTQHCSGTVDLARASGSARWLLHQIQINCV